MRRAQARPNTTISKASLHQVDWHREPMHMQLHQRQTNLEAHDLAQRSRQSWYYALASILRRGDWLGYRPCCSERLAIQGLVPW